MSNDIEFHMPNMMRCVGVRCIVINPRKRIKEFQWYGGDIDELMNELGWGLLDSGNLRKKDVRDYTMMYFDVPELKKQVPSLYVKGDPVCYGPCIIFNKGLESLEDGDVNYLMERKYLYTYDGKTGLCIRLE